MFIQNESVSVHFMINSCSILNCCELSWLAAEFQRVQNEGSIGGETRLNLQNITPAQRPMYQFLGQRVAGLYRSVWGPEGMGSRDKFEEMVKLLYHPHARFESPQTNGTDCTGWTELAPAQRSDHHIGLGHH